MAYFNIEDPRFIQLLDFVFNSHKENLPGGKEVVADMERITPCYGLFDRVTPKDRPFQGWNQAGYGLKASNGDVFREDNMLYGFTAQVVTLRCEENSAIIATPCLLDIFGNNKVVVGISISFRLRQLAPICDTQEELDKFLKLLGNYYMQETDLTSICRCEELAKWLYEHNPNKKD